MRRAEGTSAHETEFHREGHRKPAWRPVVIHRTARAFLILCPAGILALVAIGFIPVFCGAGVFAGLMLFGMVPAGGEPRRIRVGIRHDWNRNINIFTLSLNEEIIMLEPEQVLARVDRFKWCARKVIQEPRAFQVHPDGAVEINAAKIPPTDPESAAQLEREINRREAAAAAAPAVPSAMTPQPATVPPAGPGRVRFKVRLDHLGHLLVECFQGAERVEASLRGIPALVVNGLILKPNSLHVDPMQRAIEIDGVRFECSASGAQQLEGALNARYAPSLPERPDHRD